MTLIQVADTLRKSKLGQVFGPGRKDVYAWRWQDGVARFAFVMDLRRMPESGIVRGGSAWFPWEVQRAFGVEPDWDGFRSHLSEAIPVLEKALSKTLRERAILSIMPLEGQPWNPDGETEFYSSRRKRLSYAAPPNGYMTWEDEEEHVDYPGVDLRYYLPRIEGVAGPVLWRREDILVACTVSIEPNVEKSEDYIGGLVMPSVRVGSFPEFRRGKITFALPLDLIERGLRPSPRPSTWPVVLYDSPVWSAREENPMLGSTRLFAQLTGSWRPGDYESDVFAWGYSGPPKPRAVREKKAKVIQTVRRAMLRAERLLDSDSLDPSMQAKVFGLLDLQSAPVAVCTSHLVPYAEDFLALIDWQGELLALDDGEGILDAVYHWAHHRNLVDHV